jgi:hypothetical protein
LVRIQAFYCTMKRNKTYFWAHVFKLCRADHYSQKHIQHWKKRYLF